ncbi:MAG TPA: RNA polymerase subunit sigma-70 [Flexivirga sp.]|uniref:RNA polymerase subunit sigma-70 n=1 Tax=Flexivirga sp. TaxID=1962927 RepID=UPI002CB41516|nr:RNA polymerase subunit sigma-70 [Flexivirga sp.]HWC24120.1 RNA polymerase subunit sigma-70 [Flexivirga sp.]
MSEISSRDASPDADSDLRLAGRGDRAAYDRLVRPLLPELHAHCYRMLAAAHDADDALQETLVKAWRGLGDFEGRSTLRTWLYTVATRSCIDLARARGRRAMPVDLGPSSARAVVDDAPNGDIAWLSPYAGEAPQGTASPAARYEQREAVELAFVAALQHLPGNQRAALLLFDVLGFPAEEIATMMRTTTTSVNSALQRARTTIARRVPDPSQQVTARRMGDRQLHAIVEHFTAALERRDTDALVDLVTADVTWAMPPMPHWYAGRAAVEDFAAQVPMGNCGSWRTLPTTVNAQPAVACYLRPEGAPSHGAWAITALTLRDTRISGITSFLGLEHFIALGLPAELPPVGQ